MTYERNNEKKIESLKISIMDKNLGIYQINTDLINNSNITNLEDVTILGYNKDQVVKPLTELLGLEGLTSCQIVQKSYDVLTDLTYSILYDNNERGFDKTGIDNTIDNMFLVYPIKK